MAPWILAGLVLLPLAAYARVAGFDFVNYDDPEYVVQNPMVRAGLTARGLLWALTTGTAANWHPVTWLSHMVDCQLFGLDAGAHHVVNLGLHLGSTALWFHVFRRMTGAVWRSAFVAALFALHPAHVESVAWIAERKDVLSTLLWAVTVAWWVRYVQARSRTAYALAVVAYALGLMAKPMLVTVPFTLLLLDWWPLGRWSGNAPGNGRLVLEKLPFFALATATSVVTFVVQRAGGAVVDAALPLPTQLTNAIVSYARYLGTAVWPAGLAVYYPYTAEMPSWQPVAATLLLVAATTLVLRASRPYLVTGWLWFLGTLVPVIGLVQVGSQAMADRFTYVSFLGLFVIASWGGSELAARWRLGRSLVAAIAATLLAACTVLTWIQVGYWHDSIALFRHAIAVTRGNFVAYNNLGLALAASGHPDEAIANYSAALQLRPSLPDAHYNVALALTDRGRLADAIPHYEFALRRRPNDAAVHHRLGLALGGLGRQTDAVHELTESVRLDPDSPQAHHDLGLALASLGRWDEAISHYEASVRLAPQFAPAYNNLGLALDAQGRSSEAVARYREALRLDPTQYRVLANLGVALTTRGETDEAIVHLRRALELEPQIAELHYALGDALAAQHRAGEAGAQYREALRLRPGWTDAADRIAELDAAAIPGAP